ncbi:MAG: DUF4276 family protein [Prevotellaceae bacterium]|jgi:hypothetical protein|nr:DUF4276 family protein [Prevotellaceae bacterium]
MEVFIVGEDPVTKAIVERVIRYCSDAISIINELPARGGQIKRLIPEFNKLSAAYPVVLLTDLDQYQCAPLMLREFIPHKNKNFIFNIAVDEAEAWLMADREGFADYFKIALEDMPIALLGTVVQAGGS